MSARPPAWRTGVLLLIMLAFLAGVGWFGYRQLVAPIPASTPTCDSQTVAGALTSDQVTVRVYNGGTKVGLAASIQQQLKGKGFRVPYIGNTQQAVVQTTVIGGAVDAPEVKLVAAFFPGATVSADQRADHTVDVLVGDSFAGIDDTAATQIAVQQAVICGSSTSTPSGTGTTPPPTAQPTA